MAAASYGLTGCRDTREGLQAPIVSTIRLLIIEICGPIMRLIPEASLYDMPQLRISDN